MNNDPEFTPSKTPEIFTSTPSKDAKHKVPIDERVKIVNDVVANKMNPDWKEKEPDNLEKFFARLDQACRTAYNYVHPIGTAMLESGEIHGPTGRAKFRNLAVKALVDNFKDLSREEAIFGLAYTHAKLMMDEFV